MNRSALVLLVTVLASVATFWFCYRSATRPATILLAEPNGGMEWLRSEYHLSDAQFAKIEKLHQTYYPGCAQRCQRIAVARAKVREMAAAAQGVTPEMQAALSEWTSLENDCRQALLQHVFAVSAEMPPEEGRRYLKMATASIVGNGKEHEAMMAHPMGCPGNQGH